MSTYVTSHQKEEVLTDAQLADFTPMRVIQIELDQPLPEITAHDGKTGQTYMHARCLVRLHGYPLGMIEIQLKKPVLSGCDYAQNIWDTLGVQINQHLRQDGLPMVASVNEIEDTVCSSMPRCIEERELFFNDAPFVSVVVCTRDRPEQLPKCIDSLLALHYPKYEIIVVDNAPRTTATADLIQQNYGSREQIRYVCEERPGLAQARNCGSHFAKGEIIAFTDDDVVIDAYWLLELVKGFRATDNVACVTGLILPLELETLAQYRLEEYGGFSKGFAQRTFDMLDRHVHLYKAGLFGSGANMAFRASFLRSIGGFDPSLGAGSPARSAEETAAFLRVIVGGYKLVYEPGAMLYHLHRRDYPGLCKQIYNYGVGFTAYLMKSLLENPELLLDLFTKVPYSLLVALISQSPKEKKLSAAFLKELRWIERKGMLYGLLAYVQSRWMKGSLYRTYVFAKSY